MKCHEAIDLLGDLVDDDLPSGLRVWLNLHLLLCRHCRNYLASYRSTVHIGRDAFSSDEHGGEEEIPDEQIAAILKAVRSQTTSDRESYEIS